MPRRNYLITYDVSDDKRRTRLFNLLEDHGDHAQYSVFFCQLNLPEFTSLRAQITHIINDRQDQVLILDLGLGDHALDEGLEVLGSPYKPLLRTLVI